jgi:5-methylthioadenosine/S-adenosylhomocysteine deaminase
MMENKSVQGLKARYICISPDLPLIENGFILWHGDEIISVGTTQIPDPQLEQVEWLDHCGSLIMPGFTNAHEHGRGVGSLRMGVPDDMLEIWLPQNTASRPLNLHLAALYNGLLMISSEITTTMHFHRNSNPFTLEKEIDQVLQAYQDVGIRVCIGIPFRNQNTLYYGGNEIFLDSLPGEQAERVKSSGLVDPVPDWQKNFAVGIKLQKAWQGKKNHWACWAPANLHWCSDDLLIALSQDESNLPIQIHLVETILQQKYGYKTFNKTPVSHLDEIGFLSPRISFAHSVWLTDGDIQMIADKGVQIIHNPSSNLRLRSGICRVVDLFRQGIPVGIGLDGQTLNDNQDMIQEIRLARALAFKAGQVHESLTTQQVLHMATETGARILCGPEPKRGRLEKGWAADFISVKLDAMKKPYLDECIEPLEALVSLGKPGDIDLVVVAGLVHVKNGKHLRLELAPVEEKIQEELGRAKSERDLEMESLLSQLKPYYQDLYSKW